MANVVKSSEIASDSCKATFREGVQPGALGGRPGHIESYRFMLEVSIFMAGASSYGPPSNKFVATASPPSLFLISLDCEAKLLDGR